MATLTRREILSSSFVTAAGTLIAGNAFAQTLRNLCAGVTPAQTEGPFYPEKDQADKDNDLTVLKGGTGVAQGQIIFVLGNVLGDDCKPVQGALVEIWQACKTGKYNHSADSNTALADPNFQYWGQAITNELGQYEFKTILPGAYPADTNWIRPPHIHFKVAKLGFHELTTQLYFEGQSLNGQDLILKSLPVGERKKVVVKLLPDPKFTQPVARFDITLQRVF